MLDAIQRVPDDVDFGAAIDEIRILQRIEAAEEGRVRNHEEVRELIRAWTSG